ncbi:MAG: aminotransferase class IV, partial [Desulfobacterales bacterium]|nr:aminotransferase class IV [Desulfobacterales bacterium]
NILLIKDKTVVKPVSPHVLPGVMESTACELLIQWDYKIENKNIHIEDCFENYQVILTNSLMGAVPVLSIDGKKLAQPTDLCETINKEVL